jgi:hypothetical protein
MKVDDNIMLKTASVHLLINHVHSINFLKFIVWIELWEVQYLEDHNVGTWERRFP